jgi:hypothetical protein
MDSLFSQSNNLSTKLANQKTMIQSAIAHQIIDTDLPENYLLFLTMLKLLY